MGHFREISCFCRISKNPDAQKRGSQFRHRRFYILLCERGILRSQLVRKTLSAFSASSLEYVSAVSSSHSLSEAVLLLSLSLLGLVCSEHFLHLLDIRYYSAPQSGSNPEA